MNRAPDAAGLRALHAVLPAGDDTLDRLAIYVDLLRRWQGAKNLVAPGTLDAVWSRHIADSAQALAAAPGCRRWADLGSGAGFPGLVIAILLAGTADAAVHLVESNGRKAAFLRTVARETGAPAVVHAARVEVAASALRGKVDAVCARAFAPLPRLLAHAEPILSWRENDEGAVGIFHKGQDFAAEVTAATQSWSFDLVEHASKIESTGRILEIRHLRPRAFSEVDAS